MVCIQRLGLRVLRYVVGIAIIGFTSSANATLITFEFSGEDDVTAYLTFESMQIPTFPQQPINQTTTITTTIPTTTTGYQYESLKVEIGMETFFNFDSGPIIQIQEEGDDPTLPDIYSVYGVLTSLSQSVITYTINMTDTSALLFETKVFTTTTPSGGTITQTGTVLVTDPASFSGVPGKMAWIYRDGREPGIVDVTGVGAVSEVPEPWTLALMTTGFALLGLMAAWERKPKKMRLDC